MLHAYIIAAISIAMQSVAAQQPGDFGAADFINQIEGGGHRVISSRCEQLINATGPNTTEEMNKAFRDCLYGTGSSYVAVQNGCLECKVANNFLSPEQAQFYRDAFAEGNREFRNLSSAPAPVWNTILKYLHWDVYGSLPKARESNGNRTEKAVQDYFTNPVKPQNIGTFVLGDRVYPPTGCPRDGEHGAPPAPAGPIENRDPVGREVEAVIPTGGEAPPTKPSSTTLLVLPSGSRNITSSIASSPKPTITSQVPDLGKVILYVGQINVFNFNSFDDFTFGCVKEEPIRIADVSLKPATRDDVRRLPNAAGCISCLQKSVSNENIQKAASSEAKPASEAAQSVLGMIEDGLHSIGQSHGQISLAAQLQVEMAFAGQFGNTTASSIPNISISPDGLASQNEKRSQDDQRGGSGRSCRS